MSRVEQGTKVLVHSKTAGCPIEEVFSRNGDRYPRETPFFAWIGKHADWRHKGGDIYTLAYGGPLGSGGDYYTRSDFQVFNEEYIKDGDILL